jgi:hypothetical protein
MRCSTIPTTSRSVTVSISTIGSTRRVASRTSSTNSAEGGGGDAVAGGGDAVAGGGDAIARVDV